MSKEKRTKILAVLDTRTKVLGLISLIAEALFLGSIFTLPKNHIIFALLICAVILIVTIIGIVIIEKSVTLKGIPKVAELKPSPLTPDSKLIKDLIDSAIHAMCRAVSLPQTPEIAKLRVFIFCKKGDQLICTHYWAPNPIKEMVGKLKFDINSEVAKRVAVVRAVIDASITRTEVKPLPPDFKGLYGEIADDLSFVLAAPIYTHKGEIWGTTDFDAGNEIGKQLLSSEVSDAAMYQLSQHLKQILSLPEALSPELNKSVIVT